MIREKDTSNVADLGLTFDDKGHKIKIHKVNVDKLTRNTAEIDIAENKQIPALV